MTYVIDKKMIHRCNTDRLPTYRVVATGGTGVTQTATQTITAENPMCEVINDVLTIHTPTEALALCEIKLLALDGAIT